MDFSNQRVQVREHVMLREVGGEAVILNVESEQYFGLDEVGTRMWAALIESESIQAALETLLDEYEVDEAQLASDMQTFIETLAAEGLIDIHAG